MTYQTESEQAQKFYLADHQASMELLGTRVRPVIETATIPQFNQITQRLYDVCKGMGRLADFPLIYAKMVQWRVAAGRPLK